MLSVLSVHSFGVGNEKFLLLRRSWDSVNPATLCWGLRVRGVGDIIWTCGFKKSIRGVLQIMVFEGLYRDNGKGNVDYYFIVRVYMQVVSRNFLVLRSAVLSGMLSYKKLPT